MSFDQGETADLNIAETGFIVPFLTLTLSIYCCVMALAWMCLKDMPGH